MKILSIDSSTEMCSVALKIDDAIYSYERMSSRQHTRVILSLIIKVLAEGKISVNHLDAIAFGSGPGTFKGIRLAAGITQGLAYGANLPVIPISTLAVIAQGAFRAFNNRKIIPCLDACMGQIYWGAYEVNNKNLVVPVREDVVIVPDKVIQPQGNNWMGIGDGWMTYLNVLKDRVGNTVADIHFSFRITATDLLTLAIDEFNQGNLYDPDQAFPAYLRSYPKIKKH